VTILAWMMLAACVVCAIALLISISNLGLYRRAARVEGREVASMGRLSVCIPARNEATNIESCVRSALANDHPDFEVLVYDDHSDDGTGEIVRRLSVEDARVRAVPTAALPDGWNGKQFACDQMARASTGDWLLFTDADVRFSKDCFARSLAEARRLDCALLSTIPRQITGSIGEHLIIPLIHFILLSYLPMRRMRRTLDPAASAGVGQFLLARKDAYVASGGHAAFASTMHDGVKMPRAFRRAGHRTDLFDGTDLVSCRMYDSWGRVWRGFVKNAYEGLGSVPLLAFITVMHLLGHVLPMLIVVWAVIAPAANKPSRLTVGLAALAVVIALAQRVMLALRFRQSMVGAFLHPVGVLLMTMIQWQSFVAHVLGVRSWRGRPAPNKPGVHAPAH
jgi:hypothetical protein